MEKKIILKKVISRLTAIMLTTIAITACFKVTETKAAVSKDVQAILDEANKHLGKPYLYGGTGPNSFDCSGFTQYVYKKALNIDIGRATYNQINSGIEVSYNDLQPGDLVFPHSGHVGIYIGDGKMIHSPQTGDVIKVSSITQFWRARRIILNPTTSPIEDCLFDPIYYSYRYSDLNAAFGNNKEALYRHYIQYGIKEGRTASPIFDPKYYLENNSDIARAFGANNYEAAYNHFIKYGYNENRETSQVFNVVYYRNMHPDLINHDNQALYVHFMTHGMSEGRQATQGFNVNSYRSSHSDLNSAFGNDLRYYYYHYLCYGINEGRVGM